MDNRSNPRRSAASQRVVNNDLARYGGLGMQFAGTILVLGALGYWADDSFGTLPVFLITGLLAGAVGGFISLVKRVPPPRRGGSAKPPVKDGKKQL